ncbi:MAG TPA: hypothetical protein VMU87_00470 [Stellaceae bacterium]|nr:hypothetical protein [Stellaceae bacterium]
MQTLSAQITALFSGEGVTAAANLKELVIGGTPIVPGLIWLIKKLRGKKPTKIERLSDSHVRVTIDGESFEVPMALMRLYQDLAVRSAAQKMVAEPLKRDGIDTFEARENRKAVVTVHRAEIEYFAKPDLPEETLVEATRRAAFSIISLAFKEENKWRLYDGNTQISARIDDEAFQQRVDSNQIAFAKGDILICDVKITQKRTSEGLTTEYAVEKVVEHRPALRQLPLQFDNDDPPPEPRSDRQPPIAAPKMSGFSRML